ncbi:MGMT family protein [Mycolicibacterium rhodesiae]|uniref:MGMT family protein n=1 Tax=Mycolicibacterium rhodesiae TaxID=36814 RepID=UPI0003098F22|nr:MGMT family protein [Mycolicibacterium rhodesiae]
MSIVDDVREDVQNIPAGSVAAYGDIGNRIGAGPRQVGRAMSLLDATVPWWRVVRADGSPATCHGGRARALLIEEGVPFHAGGRRVDMDRARYSGV